MRTMLIALLVFLWQMPAFAQQNAPDTMLLVRLDDHEVNSSRSWANDTARYRYNQLRYYVTTVMPYVNAATVLFTEINNQLENGGLSRRARKDYIASREGEMRQRFEDRVKALNTTQGVLLIKLIARQTGLNIYHILQETKGDFQAIKYQTWARLNGLNLNRMYHPEEEPDLERIMTHLGYPLKGTSPAAQ